MSIIKMRGPIDVLFAFKIFSLPVPTRPGTRTFWQVPDPSRPEVKNPYPSDPGYNCDSSCANSNLVRFCVIFTCHGYINQVSTRGRSDRGAGQGKAMIGFGSADKKLKSSNFPGQLYSINSSHFNTFSAKHFITPNTSQKIRA